VQSVVAGPRPVAAAAVGGVVGDHQKYSPTGRRCLAP